MPTHTRISGYFHAKSYILLPHTFGSKDCILEIWATSFSNMAKVVLTNQDPDSSHYRSEVNTGIKVTRGAERGGRGGHCQGARPARPCQLFHDSLFIECTSMTADSSQSQRPPRISLDLVLNERGRLHDHENTHLFLVTPLEREI